MTPATQTLTLETFLRLPSIEESPAWEFIKGKMLQKLMPTLHYSVLRKRLVAAIDKADKYEAFPELRCILSQQSVVPDITVLLGSRVPSENGPVEGAPDWVIIQRSNLDHLCYKVQMTNDGNNREIANT